MLKWLMNLFCCCIKTKEQDVFSPNLGANTDIDVRITSTDAEGFSKFLGEH